MSSNFLPGGSFIPDLWSRELLRVYREKNHLLGPVPLSASDHWHGQNYEAVMPWLKLLDVQVLVYTGSSDKPQQFVLAKRDCNFEYLPLCGPQALIEYVKGYASRNAADGEKVSGDTATEVENCGTARVRIAGKAGGWQSGI